jgi:hypothetical protein
VSHFPDVVFRFRFLLVVICLDIVHRFKKIAVDRSKNNPGVMEKKGQNQKAPVTNGFPMALTGSLTSDVFYR